MYLSYICHLYSEISGHRWIGVYFCTDLRVPQWMSFNGFGDPLSSSTTMRLEFVVQNEISLLNRFAMQSV